jgi:hypothetical protein
MSVGREDHHELAIASETAANPLIIIAISSTVNISENTRVSLSTDGCKLMGCDSLTSWGIFLRVRKLLTLSRANAMNTPTQNIPRINCPIDSNPLRESRKAL